MTEDILNDGCGMPDACDADSNNNTDTDSDMEICDIGDEECREIMREDYLRLTCGIYKSFFEADIARARAEAVKNAADSLASREKEIRESAERELLQKIRSRRQRVSENGTVKGAVGSGKRVSEMTREERALVARRAASGEMINLK